MAQQGGNQNLPPSSLCRMGCGFYGNPMYDGMCSKCHKDALKRRQQTSSPTQMNGRVSPLATACSVASSEKSAAAESVSQTLESSAASVETGSPTVTTTPAQDKTKVAAEKEQPETESVATLSSATSNGDETPADQDKKPKKNRCHTCRKKVGLTGFACRCGGLFCGVHRYSDKHDCSFNYKELAQKEIRKSNPVVVAEKIQKI